MPTAVRALEAWGELRTLEVERLNSLQQAMWQKAMDGDEGLRNYGLYDTVVAGEELEGEA